MNPLWRVKRRQSSGATGALLFSTLGLVAGDPFIVSAGSTVILDIDTPSLGATDISGTLRTNGAARTFTTTGITVNSGGLFELGTAAAPLTALTTINLTGAYVPLSLTTINGIDQPTNPGASRGIQVMGGGSILMHGTPPSTIWTTLNDHANAGTSSLTLAASPSWLANDPILVACTDFPGDLSGHAEGGNTEQFTITSDTSGAAANISTPLSAFRWGKLQYPIDVPVSGSGMSLTQGTFSAKKAHSEVPIVLDQRARVINMRRNIVITCPNDSDWTNKGHGTVVMWMAGSTAKFDGVQIRRGGQRAAVGRYPFHSHMWSYNANTGAFLGNASSNYVKRCVVWQSENRAFTCHGTNGMEWSDNVGYDIKGHAFFQEDGSEEDNLFYRNMMLHVKVPAGGYSFDPNVRGSTLSGSFVSMSGNGTTATVNWTGHGISTGTVISVSSPSNGAFYAFRTIATVVSANQFTYPSAGTGSATATFRRDNDQIKVHDSGASGFWITNLHNDIQDNYASDCFDGDVNQVVAGCGFWLSLGTHALGLSHLVSVVPYQRPTTTFKGCIAHSNAEHGLKLDQGTDDEYGNILQTPKYTPTPSGAFDSTDHILWKNTRGAYLNGAAVPNYMRWTVADNGEQDFFGSTNDGTSQRHLAIGLSLNSTRAQPWNATFPRACFTPYHGTLRFFDMTAVNYAYHTIVFDGRDGRGRGGGVSQGGTDSYDAVGIEVLQGQNSNIQLVNSHYGPQAVPLLFDGQGNLTSPNRNYSIAGVYHDTEGKYGPAGYFQLPITPATGVVDDYFLSGAANVANGPVSGTVACQTTSTRWFGLGTTDSITIHSNTIDSFVVPGQSADYRLVPIRSTRQNVSTGATVGTVYQIYSGGVQGLSIFRAFPVASGGRFQIDFTDGTNTVPASSSFLYLHICNANVSGDNVVLGLPWSGSVVPRICWGSGMSNEATSIQTNSGSIGFNSFASAADVSAGKAIIANVSGANLAAVVADTTGKTYWRDTSNNRLWIRYTCPATPHSNPDPYRGGGHPQYDVQYISIKA